MFYGYNFFLHLSYFLKSVPKSEIARSKGMNALMILDVNCDVV